MRQQLSVSIPPDDPHSRRWWTTLATSLLHETITRQGRTLNSRVTCHFHPGRPSVITAAADTRPVRNPE